MNYKLNEEKMFADISDNIAIIINTQTGIYYGLNCLATLVFENLINGVNIKNILNNLKTINNCPSDIEERLNNFIKSMLDFELIKEATKNDKEANIDQKIAAEANFIFEIKSYDDAQELLLADPIHEVSEETGWTPEKNSIAYNKEETKKREEKMEQ